VTGEDAWGARAGVTPDRRAVPARTARRLLAALYDFPALLLLFLLGTALLLLANRGARLDASSLSVALYRLVLVALWAAYYGWSWTRGGQTLGMRVWRIRLERNDGSPIRWTDALLRLAVAPLAWLPFAFGVLAAAWDPEHRAWHDRWSRTRVTRQPAE
jgi:uncharacterized RDD family membrane protein YckC